MQHAQLQRNVTKNNTGLCESWLWLRVSSGLVPGSLQMSADSPLPTDPVQWSLGGGVVVPRAEDPRRKVQPNTFCYPFVALIFCNNFSLFFLYFFWIFVLISFWCSARETGRQ
jgi:hypothetical protein